MAKKQSLDPNSPPTHNILDPATFIRIRAKNKMSGFGTCSGIGLFALSMSRPEGVMDANPCIFTGTHHGIGYDRYNVFRATYCH
jgi:hypothetical protein